MGRHGREPLTFVRAEQAHFDRILKNPAVGDVIDPFTRKIWLMHSAFSALAGDAVIAMGGLVSLWEERDLAWSIMTPETGPYMLQLSRAASRVLENWGARRIEAHVQADFSAGRRWAELLGFKKEGLMRAFTPDGRDYYLYARVR